MNWRRVAVDWRRVAFWFGLLALAGALLLVAPLGLSGALPPGLLPRAVVPLLALVVAGYGVKVLATAGGEVPARTRPVETRDSDADVDRVGGDIDEAFDALGGEETTSWTAMNAERVLRAELRRSAVAALTARGHAREEAERLLDAGAWTDDRRAAAFLGDEHLPLSLRVRDWASGEGARRRAEAAARELARLVEPASEDAGEDGPTASAGPTRRPAGEVFGDGLDAGTPARSERTAELEPEVEA